jgi:hypothetical protein
MEIMKNRMIINGLVLIALVFSVIPFSVVSGAEKGIAVRLKDGRVEQASGYDKSYAVCIGINDYKYWPKLNCAVSDAMNVKDVLFKVGFDEVRIIKDSDATQHNILSALSWLGKKARGNDRAVIYFSGHGETHKSDRSEIGYIIPVNCPKEDYYVNAISMSKLREATSVINAKHVLYVMDSCYSGMALIKGSREDEFVAAMTNDPVVYMITAGKAGEEAIESQGHGIFTQYFLRGMKGEADYDKNEVITGTELGMYTKKWVVHESNILNRRQTPQHGRIDGEGEIIFIPLNKRGKVPKPQDIPLPPDIEDGDDYFEKIAKKREESKRRWGTWQKNMLSRYSSNHDMDKGSLLKPSEKGEMWDKFLSKYSNDNPNTTEDQLIRSKAMERLKYWRNYKEPGQPVIREVPSYGNASITRLRSSYKDLSVSQVQSMSNISIRSKKDWGFYGHSTINHNYNLRSISGDKVVIDNATGLMWHQNGSDKSINYKKAKKWLRKLNRKGYAGYKDWRLPTLEEATSLLESSKKNGDLYIDPIFSNNQRYIWTGDNKKNGSEAAWYVGFDIGDVIWGSIGSSYYVRPVRSGR